MESLMKNANKGILIKKRLNYKNKKREF